MGLLGPQAQTHACSVLLDNWSPNTAVPTPLY